jgi:hypothetical protein
MNEKVITTKRGLYGRVNITLPLNVKSSLMEFQKRSGYKKAEFMRLALMTGYITIAHNIEKKDQKNDLNFEISHLPARKE